MAVIDVTSYVKDGIKDNKIWQMDSGTLIQASYSSFSISRSTDNGHTWTQVFSDVNGGQGLMMFEDSSHNMYVGVAHNNDPTILGFIVRSTDDGQNWTNVLTLESNSSWRMREDPFTHYLYISEYSFGSQDAAELYAYNVWRSTNGGTSWAKWLQYPHQSTPGAKDSIRHVHNFFIDSTGQKYATAGDIAAFTGTYVGTMYQINDNGTFGTAVGTFGNGPISACEADDGKILLGTDLAEGSTHKIYRYDRGTNSYTTALDIVAEYGLPWTSFLYDIRKGKDGVLYAQANNEGTNKRGALFASAENGVAGSWHMLTILGDWGPGVHIWVNTNVANSKLLVSHASTPYRTLPDLTKKQLLSFVPGNRIRRQVSWDS